MTMEVTKEDIDFLKEILRKLETNNILEHLEAKKMLADQITYMEENW